MKQCILRRALSALLCLVLALSLTACGGETETPETEGGSGMTGALSGGKGNVSEPKDDPDDPDDPEKAEAGLVLLRACMAEDDQLAGAVAYLGQREPNDRSSMTEWLLENSGDLVSELPFLLEIPAERVLGGESGKLYCIAPRDESTSLAVNHVTWESQGNGVWPVADEVLYLKLQQLPRNPEQYQRLRQFAMTHESLSALRTLYLRFAAFQTPDELDFIARTVRSAYSPYRWHEWLQ